MSPIRCLAPLLVGVCLLGIADGPGRLVGQQEARVTVRGSEITGRVVEENEGVHVGDADPVAGCWVTLVATDGTVLSGILTGAEGNFFFSSAPVGTHTLRAERIGFETFELPLQVVAEQVPTGRPGPIIIPIHPIPIGLSAVIVHGHREGMRSIDVLAGDDLTAKMAETVAATIANEPGLAVSGMGVATERPVIRGLSGDRVLMLEDGVRINDMSSSAPDHATAAGPAAARRIEVVRGPSALLYGPNALGGVINVVRDEIPTFAASGFTGSATLQGRTINDGINGTAHAVLPVHSRFSIRMEANAGTAGDLGTPLGPLRNTHLDTYGASTGATWFAEDASVGLSHRIYRNDYGIPGGFVGGHGQGVRVEMKRDATKARALFHEAGGFESIQLDGAYSWYRHSEIEPPDILGTFFQRTSASMDALARHGEVAAFASGAIGARAAWEQFDFAGSLFTPDSRRYTVAAFLYEEASVERFTFEGSLRYDLAVTDPGVDDPEASVGHVRKRAFSVASGSLGVLLEFGSGASLGMSFARAFRTPDVGELFSQGPHLAAYVFEVGNPDLGAEVGTGIDVFARVGRDAFEVQLTGFFNRLNGYIYGRETGALSRLLLPVFQFFGENATLTGFEASLEWHTVAGLIVEASSSYVRGEISDGGEPLPLMPPLRGRAKLGYEGDGWFVSTEAEVAARQDRIGRFETPTDGYGVYSVGGGIRRALGGRLHVVSATFANLTNATYRSHLSRVKEISPEAGRGLKVTYRLVF